ncbi:DNA polymerase I, partial [Salmonella enterica subsp. enterica serovar Typhi]|nr:DNA polymerase I [Salmonella enterica subsp. enterica serovar Typhi]
GFSVANEKGNFFLSAEKALSSDLFKKWAEDETKKKIVYDGKRSEVSLRHHGIHLAGAEFDVLIASYIINPSATIEDAASVGRSHGFTSVQSDEAFYGKGVKRRIPEERLLAEHLSRKAAVL